MEVKVFQEGDEAIWEKVTPALIKWAQTTSRAYTAGLWVECRSCNTHLEEGQVVLVLYEVRRGRTFKNLFCTVLCLRQWRLKILGKLQRRSSK